MNKSLLNLKHIVELIFFFSEVTCREIVARKHFCWEFRIDDPSARHGTNIIIYANELVIEDVLEVEIFPLA